jgi:hypothetical protein
MEEQWYDTERGKPKNSERNLSQCYSVHHKPYSTDIGANLGHRSEKLATNSLSSDMAGFNRYITISIFKLSLF